MSATDILTRTVSLIVEGKGAVTIVVQVPAGMEVLRDAILAEAMRLAIDGTIGA